MTDSMTRDNLTGQTEDMHPMLALLEEYSEQQPVLRRGEIVNGQIAQVTGNEVLIDVGWKFEGVLSPREVSRMAKEDIQALSIGDEVECLVINPNDRAGNLVLSIAQAKIGQDWDAAEEAYAESGVFEATVDGHNKGGLIVYYGQVRGFIPASQVDRQHGIRREEVDGSPNSPLARFVGNPIWVKIIEIDRHKNRLILSELAAMRERRKGLKSELLDELNVGEVREGVVTSLADFGAFVDVGGADGLVHLSELDWNRVSHPREVLELGETVTVKVISIDKDRMRIGLSIKQLQPEPWTHVEDTFLVGDVVPVTITRLADFGAFARLENGVEGLIHVSELSDEELSPDMVVAPDQQVAVRIIRIDPERRRIGLSLKRADVAFDELVEANEDDEAMSEEVSVEEIEVEAEQPAEAQAIVAEAAPDDASSMMPDETETNASDADETDAGTAPADETTDDA